MSTTTTSPRRESHLWRSARSLLWQQLKATSALRWSTLLAILLIQWGIAFAGLNTTGSSGLVFLPLLTFALVAPAVSLTQEREMRTRSRMLMLPVSWATVSVVLVVQLTAQMFALIAVAALNWYLVLMAAGRHFDGGLLVLRQFLEFG